MNKGQKGGLAFVSVIVGVVSLIICMVGLKRKPPAELAEFKASVPDSLPVITQTTTSASGAGDLEVDPAQWLEFFDSMEHPRSASQFYAFLSSVGLTLGDITGTNQVRISNPTGGAYTITGYKVPSGYLGWITIIRDNGTKFDVSWRSIDA